MMLVYRDNKDFIQASTDFYPVDDKGRIVARDLATHVWIEQIEANPGANLVEIIKYFSDRIARLCPNAESGYWERRARLNSKVREWSRDRLLARAYQMEVI